MHLLHGFTVKVCRQQRVGEDLEPQERKFQIQVDSGSTARGLLVQGTSRPEFARQLGLSVNTVASMCKRVYAKLAVSRLTEPCVRPNAEGDSAQRKPHASALARNAARLQTIISILSLWFCLAGPRRPKGRAAPRWQGMRKGCVRSDTASRSRQSWIRARQHAARVLVCGSVGQNLDRSPLSTEAKPCRPSRLPRTRSTSRTRA